MILSGQKDVLAKLENTQDFDAEFNLYDWVAIMAYYSMFHSVNALLRKIGIEVGKGHAHEITTNLLLHYLYFTKIIEDGLLYSYKNAEQKAKEMIVSYVAAKDERKKYQYTADYKSKREDAEKVMNDAVEFVSRLKDIEKTLSKELVLQRLGLRTL